MIIGLTDFDYDTGPGTTKLRLYRLAIAMGLDDVPYNLYVYDANGMPLEDLVEPLKGSIERNQIGFLALDHCAAAAGSEPEKSESALRFYRFLTKLKTPCVLIAHVTANFCAGIAKVTSATGRRSRRFCGSVAVIGSPCVAVRRL